MKKTESKVKKNKKIEKEDLDIIEDTREYKRDTKEEELFLEKDHHELKVFLSIVVILLLLGLVGFLYYKKVYCSPLTTFTNSLSRYQKELTSDYKDNSYNKINGVIEPNLSTSNIDKKDSIEILNNILTNMVLVSDKENTYLDINTKYKKDAFINIKLYSKDEDNKQYSYVKLDKYYDKYLKIESKYLQYYSFIRLIHEENLKPLFTSIIKDAISKDHYERTYETIDNKKLSKNTLTIKNDEYVKILTEIVNKIKNDNSIINRLKEYYPNIKEKLDNYLDSVKNNAQDITVSTYNKQNIYQDLVMLEAIYGNKKIVFEVNDNKTKITITKGSKETIIDITKNNKASYNVDFTYKTDEDDYKVNLIITLDKTNDVPTLIINDDMHISDLNKDTLPNIINDISNSDLKKILKLWQNKNS